MESKISRLEKVVEETSGVAMNISPREDGWSCYLLQQKKRFVNKDFGKLCDEIITHIEENREKVEGEKKNKPYKYK